MKIEIPHRVMESIFTLADNLTKNIEPKNDTSVFIDNIFKDSVQDEVSSDVDKNKTEILKKLLIALANEKPDSVRRSLKKLCEKVQENKDFYDNNGRRRI